jgi:hypothetical protein
LNVRVCVLLPRGMLTPVGGHHLQSGTSHFAATQEGLSTAIDANLLR